MGTIEHSGRWSAADREEALYHYLPFEVKGSDSSITIDLEYTRADAVLDVGCLSPDGFRGWSGSDRTRITIGTKRSTPGYLTGELPPGPWQVILGLHRIFGDGADWSLRITTGPEASAEPSNPVPVPVPERPPKRPLPSERGLVWLAGDLHAHTVHSDGRLSVDELACLAVAEGLDFQAITDHNTTSHHGELPAVADRTGLLLLPGQEVTTDDGHAVVLGGRGWIDFRLPWPRWRQDVVDRGGLLSICHPIRANGPWIQDLDGPVDLVEVWHASWERRTLAPIHWWRSHAPGATPVGATDLHGIPTDPRPGSPTTWVACEGDDVIGGLRAGRVAISASRSGPLLLRVGDEVIAIDAEGLELMDSEGRRTPVHDRRVAFPGAVGPHLLVDGDNIVGLTP